MSCSEACYLVYFMLFEGKITIKNNDNIIFNPLIQPPCLPQEWSALEMGCLVGIRRTRQNFTGEEIFITQLDSQSLKKIMVV